MDAGEGTRLLTALDSQPGGRQVLELASSSSELMLVGGAVRDLLLGRSPRELDVLAPDDAEGHAMRLAELIGPDGGVEVTPHGRFGTAAVRWPEGRVDVAARRTEIYPAPGALPEVGPGTVEQDLLRRDFSVNAIALVLDGGERGQLRAAPHALEDLDARRLRILHDASFRDDPTRLLRLARYSARLGFEIEPETAALATRAVADGAPATVSGARLGAELRLALAEEEPLAPLAAIGELGLLAALGLRSPMPVAQAADALHLLPADGRPAELLMALLLVDGAPFDRLEFPAGERDRIAASARTARSIAATLADERRPSKLHEVLAGATPEAVAVAGACGGARAHEGAQLWLSKLRHVRLSITGDDLLAAGASAGPELGRRLAFALALKLDGQLEGGAEAELAAAMKESV